ncbi:MAG: hypothetical protein ACLR7D_06820 [Lachnospira eligens]
MKLKRDDSRPKAADTSASSGISSFFRSKKKSNLSRSTKNLPDMQV